MGLRIPGKCAQRWRGGREYALFQQGISRAALRPHLFIYYYIWHFELAVLTREEFSGTNEMFVAHRLGGGNG